MGLINKMLGDLQRREVSLDGPQDRVLGGLLPVTADLSGHDGRRRILTFYLPLLCLIGLMSSGQRIDGERGWHSVPGEDPGRSVGSGGHGDTALHLQPIDGQAPDNIQLLEDGGQLRLFIPLDDPHSYSILSTAEARQIELKINHLEYHGALPDLSDIRLLSSLRHMQVGDTFSLALATHVPLEVAAATLEGDADRYGLGVLFSRRGETTTVAASSPDGSALSVEVVSEVTGAAGPMGADGMALALPADSGPVTGYQGQLTRAIRPVAGPVIDRKETNSLALATHVPIGVAAATLEGDADQYGLGVLFSRRGETTTVAASSPDGSASIVEVASEATSAAGPMGADGMAPPLLALPADSGPVTDYQGQLTRGIRPVTGPAIDRKETNSLALATHVPTGVAAATLEGDADRYGLGVLFSRRGETTTVAASSPDGSASSVEVVSEVTSAAGPMGADGIAPPSLALPADSGPVTDYQEQLTRGIRPVAGPAIDRKEAQIQAQIARTRGRYRAGLHDQGISDMYALLARVKLHTAVRNELVYYLLDQNEAEQALQVLADGLRLYPDRVEWKMLLGNILLGQGEVVKAGELLRSSSPDIQAWPEYYSLLAVASQRAGQHRFAAAIYRDLLRDKPYNGIWWMGLGISLEALSKKQDALYAYRHAIGSSSISSTSYAFIQGRIAELAGKKSS